MSGLDDIAVRVEDGGGAAALAILNELADMLERLAASGEGGSIDLKRVPLGPADYSLLEEVLGRGEVSAQVDTIGPSRLRETAVAGVWWITHLNAEEEILTELIEVTRCPAILVTPAEDLSGAVQGLHGRLEQRIHKQGD